MGERMSPVADHFWDYYETPRDDHFWDYYSCEPVEIKKWNDITQGDTAVGAWIPKLLEACSTVECEGYSSELSFYLSYYHAAPPVSQLLDGLEDMPEVVSKLKQVSGIVLQFLEPYLSAFLWKAVSTM